MRLITLMTILLAFNLNAQSSKTDTIMTSAECGQCKDRIEDLLNYTKGIKFSELDYTTKKLVVRYNPKKITLEEIRVKLNEIGYDADDKKADPEVVKTLPLCCQPGGMKSQSEE